MLFLLAFTATIQTILVFRVKHLTEEVEHLTKEIETFEPVVIVEQIEYVDRQEETEAEVIEPEVIETQPSIDCPLDEEIQQMIAEKCEEYDIDFAFAMAVIFRESSFRSSVISADGSDYGLMQINKINHKWLSETLGITNFLDPEQNVTAGLYMLNDYFEKYSHPALVLMAYNMGEPSAKKLWNQGIYTSDYAEAIIQQAEIYEEEIQERMGKNVSYHG